MNKEFSPQSHWAKCVDCNVIINFYFQSKEIESMDIEFCFSCKNCWEKRVGKIDSLEVQKVYPELINLLSNAN